MTQSGVKMGWDPSDGISFFKFFFRLHCPTRVNALTNLRKYHMILDLVAQQAVLCPPLIFAETLLWKPYSTSMLTVPLNRKEYWSNRVRIIHKNNREFLVRSLKNSPFHKTIQWNKGHFYLNMYSLWISHHQIEKKRVWNYLVAAAGM